jgi:hypothetical protein
MLHTTMSLFFKISSLCLYFHGNKVQTSVRPGAEEYQYVWDLKTPKLLHLLRGEGVRIPGFIEILGGSFVFSSNPLTARPSNTFLKINTINVVVNSIRWLK